MIDPKNLINISGGIIADPELIADGKIMKARIGVDYAGSEKDSDNNSGYFDIVFYLKDKDGFTSKNANFVSTQISSGKMKKGTSVSIVGRLLQERWKQDGSGRSKVVIVVEHMTYGAYAKSSSDSSSSSTSETSQASIPASF
jgi:single-stranded DNA-binding protein